MKTQLFVLLVSILPAFGQVNTNLYPRAADIKNPTGVDTFITQHTNVLLSIITLDGRKIEGIHLVQFAKDGLYYRSESGGGFVPNSNLRASTLSSAGISNNAQASAPAAKLAAPDRAIEKKAQLDRLVKFLRWSYNDKSPIPGGAAGYRLAQIPNPAEFPLLSPDDVALAKVAARISALP